MEEGSPFLPDDKTLIPCSAFFNAHDRFVVEKNELMYLIEQLSIVGTVSSSLLRL